MPAGNSNYAFLSPMGPWNFKVNTSDTVLAGAMLYWDSGTKTFRPLTDPTIGNLFAGVSMGDFPVYGNIDLTSMSANEPFVPASLSGLQSFFGTASETLTMGDPLYVGADQYTVVKAAPGGTDTADIIGYFWPDNGADLAVTAGMKVQVLIRTSWPSPDLA
jgi:hypothetical protein